MDVNNKGRYVMNVITVMKRVALTFLITLFTEMQFVVTQTKICDSPQYIELDKKGIITCRFHKDFFAVWWYSSVDFRNSRPTIEYQNKNKSGPGYESGEFDVYPNGSLIVTEVKLKHEDMLTVAYLPSEEELYDFIHIQVIVIVKPDVPFPLITQCDNVSNTCFIVASKGDMECYVRGARPRVSLDFISRTVNGDRKITEELEITPEGDGYTSRISTRNAFHRSSLLVLLVCKASSITDLFDKTESFALVQNGLANRITEKSTPITIERYDRMELHCTENGNAFTVWKRAIPPRYVDYELLLYSISFGQGFIEVFAEDIILEHNISLVIPSTDIRHEGEYFCVFGDGLSDGMKVYNVTVAVPVYPVIEGCSDQAYCKLQSEYGGSLTCSVEGIRPQVELQWNAYYENQSNLISFINPQRIIKENGDLFDVTLFVQYRVSEKVPERLTVECGVVSTNDLLSNLSKKMDLLFSTGNTLHRMLLNSLCTLISVMGNSLLYGLPVLQINRLQRTQNIAARIVTRSQPKDHITHILSDLHWLPIQDRIIFKILLLVYRSFVGALPPYLSDLLQPYQVNRSSMRSHNKSLLCERRSNRSWGIRAFATAGPLLWKNLPEHVKLCPSLASFKRSLETHLMQTV
ncbi:hypothetical protein HOLleu_04417 [Holothuria leucospilota]|uniref:Ig-like domain-containing protein n=1 Tax=Holothuria leucospilota TaxID=206669 RepID=A0A9Q1CTU3_HOLLE|nr:hypothetical protein HOLleu_04417 [Holothuria leucospilota]